MKQALAFLIVGLVVGIGATTFAIKRPENASINKSVATNVAPASSNGMPGMDTSSSTSAPSGSSTSMAEMTAKLSSLSGEAFDKLFISEMIIHHQGAISMAKLAAAQAKHPEVKELANNVVSAQSAEIIQMQAWQKSWGY